MMKTIEAKAVISAKDATGMTFDAIARKIEQLSKKAETASRRSAAAGQRASSALQRTDTIERAAPMARRSVATVAGQTARQAAGVGAGVMGLPGLGVAGAAFGGVQAFKTYAETDLQLTRIGVTADATTDQMKGLEKTVRDMAYSSGQSFQDVAKGLDSLVAGGTDLEKSLRLLPSITKTAQAAGAEIKDMSDTALALSQSLGITDEKMQTAFDILVKGGKEGKFELRDMSRYMASFGPAVAAAGYKGEEGLKKVVAILQTIRQGSGSAEEAASSFTDILGKMETTETSNKFEKMGIDIRAEMDKVRKNGGDMIMTFTELTRKALGGDLSKLPQLFGDKEARRGMLALLTYGDTFKKVFGSVQDVAGVTMGDLDKVLERPQIAINRLSESWNRLLGQFGKEIDQLGVTKALDYLSEKSQQAIDRENMTPAERAEVDKGEARRKEIAALKSDIENVEKNPTAEYSPADIRRRELAGLPTKPKADALAQKRLRLFDLETAQRTPDAQKPIFDEKLTKAIKDGEETRKLFKDFEGEITKTPEQLKTDRTRVKAEGTMGWDKSRSLEATAARAGESNTLDLPEPSTSQAKSSTDRETELMEEVARERRRGKALSEMKPDRADRSDNGNTPKPQLPPGVLHGWNMPPQREMPAAAPVTATLTGSGDLAGKVDVTVKFEAGSSLIALESSVKNLVAMVKGQFNAGNGPGSTGKSSPAAAAPPVGGAVSR